MMSLQARRCVRLMASAVVASPFVPQLALAKTDASVNVSGNVHYSTNPFLTTGSDLGAVVSTVSVSPSIEQRSSLSSLRAGGTVSLVNYSRVYSDSVDYSANLDYTRAISTRLNVRASADYSSSGSGNYRPEQVQLGTLPTILPPGSDLTLLGSQVRRSQARVAAGFSFLPSPRSSWTLDYSGLLATVPDGALSGLGSQGDYSSVSQTFGYSRQINARTNLGASVGATRVDYRRTALGDSRIINPQLTISTRVGARWNASGGVGMTFLRQNIGIGTLNSRDLSFNLSLCRDEARTQACLNGSRYVAPSAFGETRKTTSIGASYSYRLNGRDNLNFSGNYQRSDEIGGIGPSNVDYYSGSAQFRRQFRNRLSLTLDAGFSRAVYVSTRSEARAGIGLAYRLGSR